MRGIQPASRKVGRPSAGDDGGPHITRDLLIAARSIRRDSLTKRGWPVNIGFGDVTLTPRDVIQQVKWGV